MGIEVKNLHFSYGGSPVLRDISFTAGNREFLSVLGPNGVGKSTLFRCILGLQSSYEGKVLLNGVDARMLTAREMAKQIAYIPQASRPVFNFSVFDIVLMGRTSSLSPFRSPGHKDKEKCCWAMEKLGISHLAQRCYHKLSGGEQQLVLMARALVQDAPCLMLDEPTANLDFGNQVLVLEQMRTLAQEGYTVIQTTHHPEQSYLFSDRILAIHQGRILADGRPKEVLTRETMKTLYSVDVDVFGLHDDKVRVCIPLKAVKGEEI